MPASVAGLQDRDVRSQLEGPIGLSRYSEMAVCAPVCAFGPLGNDGDRWPFAVVVVRRRRLRLLRGAWSLLTSCRGGALRG